jgi:hypothetical protein
MEGNKCGDFINTEAIIQENWKAGFLRLARSRLSHTKMSGYLHFFDANHSSDTPF